MSYPFPIADRGRPFRLPVPRARGNAVQGGGFVKVPRPFAIGRAPVSGRELPHGKVLP